MTPSHDEPPSMTGGMPVDAAVDPASAVSRGAALWGRAQSFVPHVQSWWDRNRDKAQLAGPAAAYLAILCFLLIGPWGLLVALLASVVLVRSGPKLSADTMLSLYRAQPIAPRQGAALRAALATLSARAELNSTPAIAIIPSMAVGAFSAGHEPRTAILMTEGLLRRYSLREIVTITAHEIAHMKAGDLPFFALADVMTRLAQVLFYRCAGLAHRRRPFELATRRDAAARALP
jgi:Zn-dependent protease with chaperone function